MSSTIGRFQERTAQRRPDDLITVEEMEGICPKCAESMKKKGMKAISAISVAQAILDSDNKRTAQRGNLPELIKHWKKEAHPFTACKKWVEAHKGETDYPDIKDSDKFCGKLKHLVED